MSDQHHHALPPPEADDIPLGTVVFWGLGSFVAVVIVIIALGSYFWIEREREDETKLQVGGPAAVQLKETQLEAQKRLAPVEQAMEKIATQPSIK